MPPRRQRPGKHARALMGDSRWVVLSLAARAVWLGLTDIGDVVPAVRAPGRNGLPVEDFARYLAADVVAVRAVVDELVRSGVLSPVGTGYRLISY